MHGFLLLNIRPSLFLHLRFPKCFIRDDGRMGSGDQIPNHAAIIFDLGAAHTDRLLQQNPPCVFFIR